jgi:hypothetical protein
MTPIITAISFLQKIPTDGFRYVREVVAVLLAIATALSFYTNGTMILYA